ncbi:MAG: hypothetical protein AAB930_01020, partial [Patescibacteria group bacterium]
IIFLASILGFAGVVLAQAQPAAIDPESILKQLYGGPLPTTTEDVFKFMLERQAEQRVSGSSIEFTPEFPGPGEEVAVVLTSYSFDVNAAHITWIRNGRVQTAGRGQKSYRFRTGAVGTRESIELVAVTPAGDEFKTSRTLYIGDADLLWRAETAVPPEYAGKALASPRSQVLVAAIPNFVLAGRLLGSGSLMYEWTLDDRPQTAKSGIGQNSFSFSAAVAPGAVHEVSVKISNLDKTIVREKPVFITVYNPEVLIYEETASGGPNPARTVNNVSMYAGETRSFRASSYYFAKSSGDKLKFKWTLQNQNVPEDDTTEVLSVTLTNDAAGTALVGVLVEGANNIIERALTNFLINIL